MSGEGGGGAGGRPAGGGGRAVTAVVFAGNLLWVLVIGLLGPSLPALVDDLGISYGQAGLFFTLLSLGSLVGTGVGASASDHASRKLAFGACAALTAAGLGAFALMPSYGLLAALVFLVSMVGSPLGAIGQSILFERSPERRERSASLLTLFGAVGSFCAPIIVSLNYAWSPSWRWPFVEAAALAAVLAVAVATLPKSAPRPTARRAAMREILAKPAVIVCAVLVFFSVAMDLGFSYWLAEYFARGLGVSLRLASGVVGIYLVGIMGGRALVPALMRRVAPRRILIGSLAVACAGMGLFLVVAGPAAKAALCALYGLGVGPVFPLLVARGSREAPERPGGVTGILFASVSLGGMVFPLVMGAVAARGGIPRSYLVAAAVALGLLVAAVAWDRPRRVAAAAAPAPRAGR